ncbi:MAG: response regulator transcription factor [Eubacteriales bacterium]|nr:response regulator transcription factor [Eubacteriales bacterium]
MRILIAEDEKDLNNIIKQNMEEEGYSVDACYNGEDALYYLQNTEYDAAVIDVMMPIMDGFEVVKEYRLGQGKTPILFLTARDSVEDKVKGLDLGADDYLTKPFSFAELTARVRVMTRKKFSNPTNIYTIDDLSLDSNSKTVTRAGKEIRLSAKEFSLLEYMIRNKNKVLSREQIENNLYNFDYEGGTNVVDVYISYLRKKIDEGHSRKIIHTVRGYGYILKEEK